MKLHPLDTIRPGDLLHVRDESKAFYVPAIHSIGQTVRDMIRYSEGELLAVVRGDQ